MSPEIHYDQDYIEGLLHHSPEIIDDIYQRFASKEKRFILQKSGTVKDAAHIFEEALMDIYYYARRHPLQVSSFEPFLQLLCKRIWERELERRGQRIAGMEAEENAALTRDDMIDIEDVLKEGEKRRLAYSYYLQLSDTCKELLSWSLTDCLQEDIAVATKIPVRELPANRQSCYLSLFKDLDAKLKSGGMTADDLVAADRFLAGQMPEAEKRLFDARLKTDATLNQQVKRFELFRQLLAQRICKDPSRDALLHQLFSRRNAWFAQKESTPTPIRNTVILIALFAAGIAIMLYVSPWRKNIYRQFASTEMQAPDADSLRLPKEAIEKFNRGHFADAITILDKVLQQYPNNLYARYYRGVCKVDLNQLQPARADLVQVYQQSNDLKYEAAFYMGLSYLKEGHKQECLDWLLKIPPQAPNYVKVQKLIEELGG
ncbi:DNA-directed RNA polymerase specialized sigma subunit, sigma24 family [Chitinophaga eiseniae]|uniref:DNA-directed RNA polymerase specialized sigma subunit, sigma24 family n=1 Tax=Chitinophaga eiseniae TaxID=634771 RepID=A0A1T4KFC1_9BACT|nr:tetratricopeptide repeat protein [Chitinophaga eiseniae]SJZ41091.1 DNA-directed RNA polymerase specialized sigma subunit, sigma24 family [Chitinophaga eiseniae]